MGPLAKVQQSVSTLTRTDDVYLTFIVVLPSSVRSADRQARDSSRLILLADLKGSAAGPRFGSKE